MTEIFFARLDEVSILPTGGVAGQIIVKNSSAPLDAAWQTPTVLGTGVGAFLAAPTSVNLLGAVADATGSGALVFANLASLTGPNIAGVTNLTGGRIKFPASQVSDSDVNTLDDYKEGTWTPVLTFSTPGNLAITYATQNGYYTKVGRLVTANFTVSTSAFTHSTASGAFRITGLPFAPTADTIYRAYGAISMQGYTKAVATSVFGLIVGNNNSDIVVVGSGSGTTVTSLVVADIPSGGAILAAGSISYMTAT